MVLLKLAAPAVGGLSACPLPSPEFSAVAVGPVEARTNRDEPMLPAATAVLPPASGDLLPPGPAATGPGLSDVALDGEFLSLMTPGAFGPHIEYIPPSADSEVVVPLPASAVSGGLLLVGTLALRSRRNWLRKLGPG